MQSGSLSGYYALYRVMLFAIEIKQFFLNMMGEVGCDDIGDGS